MDSRLKERLEKWNDQIVVIAKAEKLFLTLEAHEKSMEGRLFLTALGKTIDDKKSYAYDSKDWRDFKQGLAEAKAAYLNEKRILDLKIKAYEAEYLTMKIEAEMINKGR